MSEQRSAARNGAEELAASVAAPPGLETNGATREASAHGGTAATADGGDTAGTTREATAHGDAPGRGGRVSGPGDAPASGGEATTARGGETRTRDGGDAPGTTSEASAHGGTAARADGGDAAGRGGRVSGPGFGDAPRLSDVDEWGRSQHLRDILHRLYDPVYEHWFRVEWQGLDKIPREGGALLVANHAGAIPADAPSIMHGIEKHLGRPVYGLADDMFKRIPFVNLAWSRLGGVQAHPDNAYRLLREQQQLITVFPEGAKGPGKTFDQRYQLRRFGRGGFVQIAMRAGVPIIPMAVVGAEETMPILFKVPTLARALGIPYFPVTANMLVGFGLLPFPAKIRIRVLDPVHLDVPPDQPRYSRSRVMDVSEEIRNTIQQALYDMLRDRRSVWTG